MICCAICNNQYLQISGKHVKSHGLTMAEYKKTYPNFPTTDVETRERRKLIAKKNNASRKGVPRTEEEKAKMSAAKKAKGYRPPWNKGIKPTNEAIEKFKATRRETERKRIEAGIPSKHKGKYVGIETRKKISEAAKAAAAARLPAILIKREQKNIILQKQKMELEEKKKIDFEQKLITANITIIEKISDKKYLLQCNKCKHLMERTAQVFHDCKFRKDLCDECRDTPRHSKAEIELAQILRSWMPEKQVTVGNRTFLLPSRLEIDIFIPHLKLCIEFCGLFWHCEINKPDKNYHINKQKMVESKGFRLITVFEDEWSNHKNIVLSRLKNICQQTPSKIAARKCNITEISSKIANTFLNDNHIQGTGRSNIRYGLYFENELVSVMTFSKENISRKTKEWEINRFASKLDCQIQGGAAKLFKKFIIENSPDSVISYADERWSKGHLYKSLGFDYVSNSPPNYWYLKFPEGKRYHRFALRKNANDDKNLTEQQNRKLQGWTIIWDCGSSKWRWTNKELTRSN